MEVLTNHSWRGNVRELAKFIERAVILTRGEELEVPVNGACHYIRDPLLPLERLLRFDKRNPL